MALHELYKYINKYYDQVSRLYGMDSRSGKKEGLINMALLCVFQIITALEEDTTAQKMQLGYRLQQIAAAVENKVTDL